MIVVRLLLALAMRLRPRSHGSVAVLAVLAVLGLAACNPPDRSPHWRAAGSAQPHDGGTLHLSIKDELPTLDPAIAYDDVSSWVLHSIYATLVDFDGKLALHERLAARYAIEDAGKTLHFWLRDGITYEDGRPIVAADFKTSLERVLAMPASPFGQYLASIDGADAMLAGKATTCAGIEVRGDRELVLHLAHPDRLLLPSLAMSFAAPLPAAYLAKVGDDLRRAPLASGAFRLGAWDEGRRLVLVRNPHGAPHAYLDEIDVLESIPRDTQFLMFERGELDAADRLASADYLWLVEQKAWQPYIHRAVGLNAYGVRMNTRRKPFDDRRVRQALNYALDKDHTVKLLNGAAVPSHGILPPGMPGRADLAPYPHDPAKARALLAEAGYPHGFDVEYVTFPDEEAEKVAASLQADLGEVGVHVRVALMSLSAFQSEVSRPDGAPFSFWSWTGDFPDPGNFIDVNFASRMIADQNSNNNTFYSNPALDAAIDAGDYPRAERILYDDAPWIWNYHRENVEVTQPYVKGYEPHPVWGRDYTRAWLDLGPDGRPVPR